MPQRSVGGRNSKSNPAGVGKPVTANEYIERELDRSLEEIEKVFGCHAVTLSGPMLHGLDDLLRTVIEKLAARQPASEKLVFLLTTGGGLLEPVQRMVLTIRRHYKVVDFIIPNYAYSAGTVFALSGDAIHMDYYSRLGPIDPQIRSSKGRFIAALGYLEKYNALIARARRNKISPAEVQLLIDGFDQGELYDFEQAKNLSVKALEDWLVEYKFKNWDKTATRGLVVTPEMKIARAREIGEILNDTKKWHSHGYGISIDVLRKELNLIIDDFGTNPEQAGVIRSYHDLLDDYMAKRGAEGVIHMRDVYRPYL